LIQIIQWEGRRINNMREFKFRVWDIKAKNFRTNNTYSNVDGISTCGRFLTRFSDHDNWDHSKGDTLPIKEFIIQQYTDLKDKNGKEIYEGDIINGKIWVNDLNGKSGWAIITNRKVFFERGAYFVDVRDYLYEIYEIEVIGNTLENPELLK
jgi:uncharacterized phage protein (TIGR01671 family)